MATVRGNSDLQSEVLDDLAGAENYRRWLVALATPWLGPRIIEVGSGTGDYAAEYLAAGCEVTATELDETRLELLRKRFTGMPRVTVRRLGLPTEETGEFSAAVAFNVVEHIADDIGALRSLGQLVSPTGHVVVFVPAFEMAMSDFDREVGHVRRYTRRSLSAAFEAAGLELEAIRYVNSLGLLAWIAGMRLLGRRPRSGDALRRWDAAVIPRLRSLEQRREPPFGQSLFAVGRKP
jgi:SAM-dependent methyltransferase